MNQKEYLNIGMVGASFLLLVASTLSLLGVLETLWRNERIFFQISEFLSIPFGGNRDVPVLVIVGMLSGWFLLFWVDATKRLQGAILSIAVLFVGWYLMQLDRILGAINRTWWALLIGLAIGLASGVFSARKISANQLNTLLERIQWLRYPGAAMAFKHSATVIAVITVIDYFSIAPQRIDALYVAVTAAVFVLSLSVFIQYAHERRIVTISPPKGDDIAYQPYVLGGLYGVARDSYGAESTGRGDVGKLNSASVAMNMDGLEQFNNDVSFTFPSSQLSKTTSGVGTIFTLLQQAIFPQPVTIESTKLTTRRIGTPEYTDSPSSSQIYSQFFRDRLIHHVICLVPKMLRELLPTGGHNSIDRLDEADTVLLVGPTPPSEVNEEWADSFSAICHRYSSRPGTDVVLATIEAGEIADQEGLSLTDGTFKSRISRRIGIPSGVLSINDVYPLERFSEDEKGKHQFVALLDRLRK